MVRGNVNHPGRAHGIKGHFYHDEDVYEDALFNLERAKPTGATSPTWENIVGLGNFWGWHFAKAATNELVGTIQATHRIKVGSLLYPHIHWYPIDANAGNVRIKLDYSIANIDGVFAVMSTESKTFASPASAYKHTQSSFTAVTHTADIYPSALIKVYIARVGGDGADTYDNKIVIESADWHVVEDSQGTYSETQTDK